MTSSPLLRRAALRVLALGFLSLSGFLLFQAACAVPVPTEAFLSTGVRITPLSAPGAQLLPLAAPLTSQAGYQPGASIPVSGALSVALSPDQGTVAVLTSGFNIVQRPDGQFDKAASTEWLFVYEVKRGDVRLVQSLPVPNAFLGLSFAPDGGHLYVSGGGADTVYEFVREEGQWHGARELALGHGGHGVPASAHPVAADVAVSPDGGSLAVANLYNDSVSIVDLATGTARELDLRPGKSDATAHGRPGGTYPWGVVWGQSGHLYVSSSRDREVDAITLAPEPRVDARIPVSGNPNRMVFDAARGRLYVAADNSDRISVIDTEQNKVTAEIPTAAPERYRAQWSQRGEAPDSLALSADGTALFVTNSGANAVAVIDLQHLRTVGLIPTGAAPSGVAVDGSGRLFVVDAKNPPGPNPGHCKRVAAKCPNANEQFEANDYVLSLLQSNLLIVPRPTAAELDRLTVQVARNNDWLRRPSREEVSLMGELHKRIHHVIYVVRENRTYDQILGDLGVGDGDARLAEFGQAVTPNAHALARQFVTLDRFFDSGEVSGNGWPWSTSARESDFGAKTIPSNYAHRGPQYEVEGTNRNLNVSVPPDRRPDLDPGVAADDDVLAGTANVAAPDGPGEALERGYLWDAALRAGLSVRNYGFFIDLKRYGGRDPNRIPLVHDPAAEKLVVAYPANASLAPVTDPYFRGFDAAFPDYWREREWEREFELQARSDSFPALSLVRFMTDHTGDFGRAIDGVNTPELQVADNDYAIGRLVEAVAHSRYAADTLVFVVEDDAQDGPDHVDAQRSIAFVAGPYVRQGALVHHRYTTVNLLRTIEDVLGLEHLSVFDSNQEPMTAVFDLQQRNWHFEAQVSGLLKATSLPIGSISARPLRPTQDARYWAAATQGMDFSAEDRVDPLRYNQILWEGLMPGRPYPVRRGPALKDRDD